MTGAVSAPDVDEIIVFGASKGSGGGKLHIPAESEGVEILCGSTGNTPKRKSLDLYPEAWRDWCESCREEHEEELP